MRHEPSQVIVRNLMRFIDGLPALYLVGGIACVLSRYRQRLGDLAAGTVVVRIPKVAQPDLSQLLGTGIRISLAAQRRFGRAPPSESYSGSGRRSPGIAAAAGYTCPDAGLGVFGELADVFSSTSSYPGNATRRLSDEQYVRDVVEVVYESAKC